MVAPPTPKATSINLLNFKTVPLQAFHISVLCFFWLVLARRISFCFSNNRLSRKPFYDRHRGYDGVICLACLESSRTLLRYRKKIWPNL